jgi:Na+-translocating ferredoxin:NAD+ oxidoreductase RnfE subunit
MELADRLQGRLLLMTGEVDENVPVASTYRMADALQKAGKRFDMMLFPEDYGALVFVLAPGAFIALGYLIAIINKIKKA